MILPIYAFGQPILKTKAVEIQGDYPQLAQLISDMWETMHHADGVGLAAPQIGLGLRLFVVDSSPIVRKPEHGTARKQVFINAKIVEYGTTLCNYEEGCLSIPDLHGDVERPDSLRISYLNENLEPQEEWLTGLTARVVQHEYDHIEGILFTDRLKPLKKQFIQKKLDRIKKGEIATDYKMKFVMLKKK